MNDDEPNIFYATLTNASDSDVTPPKVETDTMRILDFQRKPRKFLRQVSKCDVFIINPSGNASSCEEAEFVVKLVKQLAEGDESKEIVLVVMSTVLSWVRTPKKTQKRVVQETESEDEVIPQFDESGALISTIRIPKEKKRQAEGVEEVPFLDSDFKSRVPSPKYQ